MVQHSARPTTPSSTIHRPGDRTAWRRHSPKIFPKEIIGQEISQERWINIPDEVREVYKIWRPSPLHQGNLPRKSTKNTR
jgi:tryptophan synthase beta chain